MTQESFNVVVMDHGGFFFGFKKLFNLKGSLNFVCI